MASTIWRGHLTFGLISIPVRLFRAARAERTPLKRVARVEENSRRGKIASILQTKEERQTMLAGIDDPLEEAAEATLTTGLQSGSAPLIAIQQSHIARETGSAVADSQVTKAVEVAKNRFVEVRPDELQSLKVATSADLAIQEFVALGEIDPLYFETSYYVVPEEVGERAYGLLYQALVNTQVVAVGELAMHGRDHVVVVRPGGTGLVAHTMFYSSEVHLDEQFRADTASVSQQELNLAETLVSSLTTTFEADRYKNGYQAKLQELIAGKIQQQAPSPKQTLPASKAYVVDMADALRRSLAQLKKPAANTIALDSPVKATPRAKTARRANP